MNKLSDEVGKSISSMGNTINSSIKESPVNFSNFSNKSNSPINSVINNTPSIGQSIKSNVENSLDSAKSVLETQSVSNSSEGFFSKLFNYKSILFWVLLIILLAFFGLNIFKFLYKGTDALTDILHPITNLLGSVTGETTKSTVKDTSSGTQSIIDKIGDTSKSIVANTSKGTTTGVNALQSSLKKQKPTVNTDNDDKLNENKTTTEPDPIQTNSLQGGYCYIGKINDTRYCAKVQPGSKCMSGDIYPSMDICINPNLRN